MLAAATGATSALNGRDVIIAFVGGTMLTLALTRPQLRWVERLTEDSPTARLWAERALTFFSFVMAGYAATAVLGVLHKQLNHETDALLEGAAAFLAAYAWLVHLEPFSNEWRMRGGLGACVLYTCVAIFEVTVGLALAVLVLTSSVSYDTAWLLCMTAIATALGWVIYRYGPDAMRQLEGLLGISAREDDEAAPEPVSVPAETTAPTQTPARSTKA